jgi:hypothetical protein
MSSFRRVQQDTQDSRPGPFSAVPAGLFLALKSTQDWRPGLLSAVPSGLDLERVVLTQTLTSWAILSRPLRQAQGRLCGTFPAWS